MTETEVGGRPTVLVVGRSCHPPAWGDRHLAHRGPRAHLNVGSPTQTTQQLPDCTLRSRSGPAGSATSLGFIKLPRTGKGDGKDGKWARWEGRRQPGRSIRLHQRHRVLREAEALTHSLTSGEMPGSTPSHLRSYLLKFDLGDISHWFQPA